MTRLRISTVFPIKSTLLYLFIYYAEEQLSQTNEATFLNLLEILFFGLLTDLRAVYFGYLPAVLFPFEDLISSLISLNSFSTRWRSASTFLSVDPVLK